MTLTLTRMGPGGIFADILAGSREQSPVTVTAATDVTVLLILYKSLLRPGVRWTPPTRQCCKPRGGHGGQILRAGPAGGL
ncbi:MAG: hypothetical protein ACLRZH_06515 [Ruthenibacterium lactatiformans]